MNDNQNEDERQRERIRKCHTIFKKQKYEKAQPGTYGHKKGGRGSFEPRSPGYVSIVSCRKRH
ncbi:hypothetical protein [uncultured Prevotella sp.]|uniref:hypothetical protein n=1 Tax=uncultured Prevotella sp. TaxID=159272 RepID=UPI0025DF3048|nr:hypothetical protein [uncultured Prevotella sp.]